MRNRIIMHIDMNSYFASVSQHYNLEFRDKPIAIMGKGKGTVVIAASVQAKKFGVKTGTRKFEALKLCPDIIFAEPNFAAYVHTTGILMEVFHQFTPMVEPFSIDEAFLDVTNCYHIKNGMHPINLAHLIKKEIKNRLSTVITCSVGIADNKLMAKFGSDLKKPDGVVYLTPRSYTDVLDRYPLTDICGIGYGIEEHLRRLNILTMKDLRNTNYRILQKEFGRVEGRFLYLAARGESYSPVDPTKYHTNPKSLSHSETFTENKTEQNLYSDIYKLCEKVSLRLRKKLLFTKSIGIYIKDRNFEGYSFSKKLTYYTNNTLEIFNEVIKSVPYDFISRYVCIAATDLSKDRVQDLFNENEKKDFLQKSIDKINNKFGRFTVLPASIIKPDSSMENNVEIPFSGFDMDAKIGIDLTTILKKDLNIIKHRTLKNNYDKKS